MAMLRLANLYAQGALNDNKPDLERAWVFAKKAVVASENAPLAVQAIEALEKQMKKEEIDQAQKKFDEAMKGTASGN
jgi:hypothetical protein